MSKEFRGKLPALKRIQKDKMLSGKVIYKQSREVGDGNTVNIIKE